MLDLLPEECSKEIEAERKRIRDATKRAEEKKKGEVVIGEANPKKAEKEKKTNGKKGAGQRRTPNHQRNKKYLTMLPHLKQKKRNPKERQGNG